ncbi:MAG: cell surface protein SprA [Bacteroidia bacterium]|nr:cell surface protein SprA [Bacteroidia bacterium]
MAPGFKNIFLVTLSSAVVSLMWGATPSGEITRTKLDNLYNWVEEDGPEGDSTKKNTMPYPIKDRKPWERKKKNPLDLQDPPNMEEEVVLDEDGKNFNITNKVGSQPYGLPATQEFNQFLKEEQKKTQQQYFQQRSKAQNFVKGGGIIPPLNVGPKIFDRIFGSGVIDIKPQGTAELIFSGNFNTVRNPAFTARQQRTGQFDFKQKIQLNVQGSVGDKLKVSMNYDTEATFDFENQTKLNYTGKEDEIIKKIELGNVSLPLQSSLIQGSQSLFGIKTQMQFGRLTWTSVYSQQKGKITETEISGGAQITKFDIQCDNYEANKHFFLAHLFRDNYNSWLSSLPVIASPVLITRIEVWVTNKSGAYEGVRDVLGVQDFGEWDTAHMANKTPDVVDFNGERAPSNRSNKLYNTFALSSDSSLRNSYEVIQTLQDQSKIYSTYLEPVRDYQLLNYARQLSANEYILNEKLGYISLNNALNSDEMLCVAYEYTINGVPYKVGEFSTDIPANSARPNVLFLKMLKGQNIRPDYPMWDLMMKNIYSLGAYQVQPKDFRMNIIYADDPSGSDLNYIPAAGESKLQGVPLLTVLNLDRMNVQQEPTPDGNFDFLERYTVISSNGRIIFPVTEPFGSYLRTKFVDSVKANYYAFQELYDSTRFAAMQIPQKNKFFLRGSYQSAAGSEIPLGSINVPKGSVKVTANGTLLTEGSDYIVDYSAGRVRIINTGLLSSGAVIKVSSESNTMFNIQQKTLIGSRFDFKASNDVIFGGTVMYLREKPLTPKVNIGEEPIANMVIGVDGSINKQSRWLTKMVDKLPFIETKEMSSVQFSGEYARLFPGVQKMIGKGGNAYIDDFEGSETPIDLKGQNNWMLASIPQGQPTLFPEASLGNNNLGLGFRRALLSWYSIDPLFTQDMNLTPKHIKEDLNQRSNHMVRAVTIDEIWPSKKIQQGMPTTLQTFDLAFYPYKRGPYNYTINGLNGAGQLTNPQNNWGGIMRRLETNDFEAANIDYIEIWMMDPYMEYKRNGITNPGELYINLGNVSEDVLKDSRKSFENGLPKDVDLLGTKTDTTAWGKVPVVPTINFAFDSDPNARKRQDAGLDGLIDDDEIGFFNASYLQKVQTAFGPTSQAYLNALEDPSGDNFHYFRGTDFDNNDVPILVRYQRINSHEGNSPTPDQSPESYPTAITNTPDDEDLNKDFTINELEEYYQYRVDISENGLQVGKNYVTDRVVKYDKELANGKKDSAVWFQIKIPVHDYESKIGQITDFKSIRFMRMFLRGFSDSMILRFAQINLVRADWRKYTNSLVRPGEHIPIDPNDLTDFVVSTVNIEENSKRTPIIYTLPPGIIREQDISNPQPVQLNEQSLSLKVCNLKDGDAKAVFKTTVFDIRNYKKLKMFLHAEGDNLKPGELTAFIRLGTDLTNNYYEYEIPLTPTAYGTADPNLIWPSVNEISADIEDFYLAKQNRTSNNVSLTVPYTMTIGTRKITVLGLPDLSNVKVIMLGVRNPKRSDDNPLDDALPKCGEVWFNELRVSDFINRGGWATTGRVVTKLADFGTLNGSVNYYSVGWGGIDKKLNERSLKEQLQLSFASNFELGKFFPVKSGISIPMFYSYSQTSIKPLYNPLNPDIKLSTALKTTNVAERQRIIAASEDFTTQRSINFTNIRKNRVGSQKAHVYDVENLSFSYSYSEIYKRNEFIEYQLTKNYQVVGAYSFNFQNKPVQPFKKVKPKSLVLVKEFNFNYLPSVATVRYTFDRRYGETIYRNNDSKNTIIAPLYDKNYTMTRFYELRWDLTRSLKLDYTATVNARIDEPAGKINTQEAKDSIRANLLRLGRTTNFNQTAALTYNVPINKIPALNWVTVSTRYSAQYTWQTAPPAADSLGNTITNQQAKTINGQLNMTGLYNKSKFLQKINNPAMAKKLEEKAREEEKKKPRKYTLKTRPGTTKKDTIWEKVKPKKKFEASPIVKSGFRLLMSLRSVTFSYGQSNNTTLPGFSPKPGNLGQDWDLNAPGLDFIFGSQDPDFRYRAARNGWISNDLRIASQFSQGKTTNFNIRAILEPIPDMRVEVTMKRDFSITHSANFKFDTTNSFNDFRDLGAIESGTFSMTFNIFNTAFKDPDATFKKFVGSRYTIAKRLQNSNPFYSVGTDPKGFPKGYSGGQQEVLMYSFLSAYSGKSPDRQKLQLFPSLPDMNWRITYNGLSKLELLKEYTSNVSISHSYSSVYSIPKYTTSVNYFPGLDSSGLIQPKYIVSTVSITERFAPLLGVDVTFLNSLTTSFSYNTDRTLNLAITNSQITESRNKEYTIGIGYRPKELKIPFISARGRQTVLKNDINMRMDFSIRDNRTIVRKIDQSVDNQPVNGNKVITIRPTIDYMINEKLNIRIFYDRRVTKPATSNTFPTAITSGGFSMRYTIQ